MTEECTGTNVFLAVPISDFPILKKQWLLASNGADEDYFSIFDGQGLDYNFNAPTTPPLFNFDL